MILTTTPTIAGKEINSYCGVIGAEVIFGANFLKDVLANATDFLGGRSSVYEKTFADARTKALEILEAKAREKKANAVVAVKFDYQTVNDRMMMVAATGTAVFVAHTAEEKSKAAAEARDQEPIHYVVIDGAEKGPFSVEQIRELQWSGKFSLTAKVRTEGREEARLAAELIAR
jgi:uncharacterized protein YbjQ (UPF0145 family)